MDEESIHQDRELARAAIKGLASYAEQIAHKGKDDEIQQVRSLTDALSLYWGVDEKRGWTGEFDEKVWQASQKRSILRHRSSIPRIKAIMGLCRYAEEMNSTQGVEEMERILEIPDVIRRMGKEWEMCQSDIENPAAKSNILQNRSRHHSRLWKCRYKGSQKADMDCMQQPSIP